MTNQNKLKKSKINCYGSIKVFLFSKFFLIPFAKMISEVLQDKKIQFNIPNQFVDNILMNDDEIKKIYQTGLKIIIFVFLKIRVLGMEQKVIFKLQ